MLFIDHFDKSLYYNYLSFAVVCLYLSLLGSYIFLYNVSEIIQMRNKLNSSKINNSFTRNVILVTISLTISINPFFANNYELGVGFILFLTLSLAAASEALKFNTFDYRFISLLFLTSFFLILGYGEYILLPVYFIVIFITILIPVTYKTIPKIRVFLFALLSSLSFYFFSGESGFILSSVSGYHNNLFPFFRPVNLEHEYALLSVSGIIKAISGLSFNISFSQLVLSYLEGIAIVNLYLVIIFVVFSYWLSGKKKPIMLFTELTIVIILSLPYNGLIPIIGYIPLFLISNHTFLYNHLGEVLSIFDVNRLLLFPYWFLLGVIAAISISINLSKLSLSKGDSFHEIKSELRRHKSFFNKLVVIFLLTIFIMAALTTMIGPYNYLNFEKSSPTYAYANNANDSYNRILFYQNPSLFYPGNIYPSYMEMQADIPDKPVYENFVNMESSPLISPTLNSLPPASFVYHNNTERFVNGRTLSSSYNCISNQNENVTVGYPIFIIGSQYTFDQFIFNNYYKIKTMYNFSSVNKSSKDYGRFNYFNIPTKLLKHLSEAGNLIEINTNIELQRLIKNDSAYTFGVSNSSAYFPTGNNEMCFGIASFNSSSIGDILGVGNPIDNAVKYSEYLSIKNAFSYNLQNFIPIQGNEVKNVTVIFYNGGKSGIFGFINFNGQWYQSQDNYSISQIKYFYFQAYQDFPQEVHYNITMSELIVNKLYKNVIPIYYDSTFSNISQLTKTIERSDLVIEANNFSVSNLVGSYIEACKNSTIINPSAYSIEEPEDGWYQAFPDGAAQSSYFSEDIPIVVDQPYFGYNAYDGFAQSVVGGSSFKIPINDLQDGGYKLELNLLFSPFGGNLTISYCGKEVNISTFANSSYYSWYGININGNPKSLKITNQNGVQSINQIAILKVNSYIQLKELVIHLLNSLSSKSFYNLQNYEVIKSSLKVFPVQFNAQIKVLSNFMDNLIVEYSNPTYSDFSKYSTNSVSLLTATCGAFPSIIVSKIKKDNITVEFYEQRSVYFSGYLPYLEIQLVWIPVVIDKIIKNRKSKRRM
jgi:hypothetical protein